MRDLILKNKWPAGYQATEQEIANHLEMSRTPVREAMMRLQQEELVQVVPRHGLRVLPVSVDDMREIYEVLTSLEATAAGLAAERSPTDDDLKPLVTATAAMERALTAKDLEAWARADESFHKALIALSGNRKLEVLVSNFMDRVHRARMVTLRMRNIPTASTIEHSALVDAIRRGEPEAASEIHKAHRQRAGRELLTLLSRVGLNQI